MVKLTSVLIAGVALGFAGSALAQSLNGTQISNLLSDSLASGKTDKGQSYTITYDADGDVRFKFDDNSYADTGKWPVDGDVYCAEWRKIRSGKRGCWTVVDEGDGDGQYLFKGIDGMDDATVRIRKQ